MRFPSVVLASVASFALSAFAFAADSTKTEQADVAPVARTFTTIGDPAKFKKDAITVLITGSNRGLGLEFVRQLTDRGWNIIATAREPAEATELMALQADYPQLVIEEFDVTDTERLENLDQKYDSQTIDLLLSNAGIVPRYKSAFQKLDGVDWDMSRLSFDVNALAPLQLANAFQDNVAKSKNGKIVVISSKAGSFDLGPKMPMMYSYRASKAALNMFMYTFSFETQKNGVILTLLSPGQVNTTPGFKMKGNIEPDESVSKMLAVIDSLTMDQNGQFLDYEDGRILGW